MRETYNLSTKLKAIADDIEIQHKSMRDVWYRVSVGKYYNTGYLATSRYYEIEMLEDFKRFENYTQITEKYFLYFDNNNSIYTSSGSKYTPELFTRFMLPDYDTTDLINSITEKDSFSIIHQENSSQILFVLPKNSFTGLDSVKKVLCFIVDKQSIINRTELLVGKLEGRLSLSYDGDEFCTVDGSGDEIISANSTSNDFQVTLCTSIPSFLETVFDHNPNNVWFGLLLVIILSVIGLSLGVYLYQPVRHMKNTAVRYFGSAEDEISSNELITVNNAFERLVSSRNSIMQQVDTQYMMLRNQMLKLILCGDGDCIERAKSGFLDINLSGTVFCVGIVQTVEESEIRQFQSIGESLFWCKGLQDDVYSVLLSTDNEDNALRIQEDLQNHFYAFDRRIVFSECFDNPYLFCEKAANTYKRLAAKPPLRKSTVDAVDIVEYINANYQRPDLSLDQMSEVFSISARYISTLVRKQTNRNYKEFLTDIRMKHAKELVKEGKLLTKEIAEAVGYLNVSLFIKTYKATFGITPANSKQDD